MQEEDWLVRWREGRTGWHQNEVTPLLRQHWPALQVPAGARVLVPLCGKTLDLLWLAGQGFHVLGIELSVLAVQQFFAEHALQASQHETADGVHYRAGSIEVIQGNIFDVRPQTLAGCNAVYDRAALIALPPEQRRRYARHVYGHMAVGAQGLLITLEYDHEIMSGPPFSVPESEVRTLLAGAWETELAQRRSTSGPGRAADKTGFDAAVYRLGRR